MVNGSDVRSAPPFKWAAEMVRERLDEMIKIHKQYGVWQVDSTGSPGGGRPGLGNSK